MCLERSREEARGAGYQLRTGSRRNAICLASYTAKDKNSHDFACKRLWGIQEYAKKEVVCSSEQKLEGSLPYSNLKAEGKCN